MNVTWFGICDSGFVLKRQCEITFPQSDVGKPAAGMVRGCYVIAMA